MKTKSFWALAPKTLPKSVSTKEPHQMIAIIFKDAGQHVFKLNLN